MATQYPGDRTALQIPSPLPADGATPIGVLPDDGDDLNVSSVLHAFKVSLDFIDYLSHRFEDFPGVRSYDASRTYTEGMMCLDTDGKTYRVKTGQSSVGIHPNANSTKWERWAYSETELAAANVYSGNADNGMITFPGGFRIYYAALTGTDLPNEGTPSKTYTFATAFATTCLAAFFQPTTYSATTASAPQVLVAVSSKSAVALGRPTNSGADGASVATGYLLAIGF